MEILTRDNFFHAKYIENIKHPEWGIKKTTISAPLIDGSFSLTYGAGIRLTEILDSDFHNWHIVGKFY